VATRLGTPYREWCDHKTVKISAKWNRCLRCGGWVPRSRETVPKAKKKDYSETPDSPAVAEARLRVQEMFDKARLGR